MASQAPVRQARSHAQASLQLMSLQEASPVQVIAQVDPASQVTLLQAPAPMQLIVQVQSLGQVTLPQLLMLEHSMRQVCFTSSHEVQSAGHCGTTQ